MAHRHFEGKMHAAMYAKYRPIPPTKLFERIVSFIREKYKGEMSLSFDVGCGSGQSTQFIAPYFRQVIGTDVSKSQVDKAIEVNKLPNVSFQVSPAEKIPAKDNSVQLVSASQAAHWFDLPKFYEETKRVLCTGGALCMYGYELPKFRCLKDPSKNKDLDAALDQFYLDDLNGYVYQQSKDVYLVQLYAKDLKGHWSSERVHVDSKYSAPAFKIPYGDFTRDESCFHEVETTVLDVAMYCATWSGYQHYVKVHGKEQGEKLIEKFIDGMMSAISDSTEPHETKLIKRTNFFLLMGRKDS